MTKRRWLKSAIATAEAHVAETAALPWTRAARRARRKATARAA